MELFALSTIGHPDVEVHIEDDWWGSIQSIDFSYDDEIHWSPIKANNVSWWFWEDVLRHYGLDPNKYELVFEQDDAIKLVYLWDGVCARIYHTECFTDKCESLIAEMECPYVMSWDCDADENHHYCPAIIPKSGYESKFM